MQAIRLRFHRERRIGAAIHEHGISQNAVHLVHHHPLEDELIVGAEAAVLDHEGELVLRRGQAESSFVAITNDQQSGEAEIDLLAGAPMRMGVIEIRACRIDHGEVVAIFASRGNGETRMTIGDIGNDHSVPMDNA